jgi:tetratricopeptide (TPR) repeat protein
MFDDTRLRALIEAAQAAGQGTHHRTIAWIQQLAEGYQAEGQLDEAEREWEQLTLRLDEAAEVSPSDRAAARTRWAIVCQKQGRLQKAAGLLQQAVVLFEEEANPPVLDFSATLNQLTEIWFALGEFTAALGASRRAATLLAGVVGPAHPELLRIRNNLGALAVVENDLPRAARFFQSNLRLLERLVPEHSSALIFPLHNLAEVARQRRDWALAETYLERSWTICQQQSPPQPWHQSQIMGLRATVAVEQGRLSFAETLCRAVLEGRRQQLPAEHPDTARAQVALAEVLMRRGKWDEAEPLLDAAAGAIRSTFGDEHLQTAAVQVSQARVALALGRPASAEQRARSAWQTQQRLLAPHDVVLGTTFRVLAQISEGLLREKPAAENWQQAMLRHELPTRRPLECLETWLGWADWLGSTGDHAAAIDAARRAGALGRQLFLQPHSWSVLIDVTQARWQLAAGHHIAANSLAERAVNTLEALPERSAPTVAAVALLMCDLRRQQSLLDEALVYGDQAVELWSRMHGPLGVRTIPALVSAGATAFELKQFAVAERYWKQSLAAAEKAWGSHHAVILPHVERLARLALAQRQWNDLKPWLRRALDLLPEESDLSGEDTRTNGLRHFVDELAQAGQPDWALDLSAELAAKREKSSHVLSDLL